MRSRPALLQLVNSIRIMKRYGTRRASISLETLATMRRARLPVSKLAPRHTDQARCFGEVTLASFYGYIHNCRFYLFDCQLTVQNSIRYLGLGYFAGGCGRPRPWT